MSSVRGYELCRPPMVVHTRRAAQEVATCPLGCGRASLSGLVCEGMIVLPTSGPFALGDRQPIDKLLDRLESVKRTGDGKYTALCPTHEDRRPSLSISVGRDGRVLLHCHAGCRTQGILASLGLSMGDLFPEFPKHITGQQEIVKTYDYVDEAGKLLFQVCRTRPKGFKQRRPDGQGGWQWDTKGVRRVLYRLPGVKAAVAESRTLYVTEGEKDADALTQLGLTATTNAGGAGKWRDEDNQALAGGTVVILPDNDPAGYKHAQQVAHSLAGCAASVRVVQLPDLPEKGDVSDWLAAGGTVESLREIVDAEPDWQLPAAPGPTKATSERPRIDAGQKNLETVSAEAIAALVRTNQSPRIFVRGGIPVRIESDGLGRVVLRDLTPDRLRYELARAADWFEVRTVRGTPTMGEAKPPMDVCRDLLAAPKLPFPVLQAVVRGPIFTLDGTFNTTCGYDLASRTYLDIDDTVRVPSVPRQPAESELAQAKQLLLVETLGDFPFVADADLANAMALILLPFTRPLIPGPSPLHIIEATGPGTGKSLLATVLLYPSAGDSVGMVPPPRDDEELRKSLTSRLRDGWTTVVFDNVSSLSSPVLSAALTALSWEDRILGRSEVVRLPVRCAWVATSNNASVSTEIARRSIRIRLDAGVDRPWLRSDWRHPNLRGWVAEHRAQLIWAAAVLVRNWLSAGRPAPSSPPLGSFESWHRVIGGILETAAISGFLTNSLEFYEAADPEGAAWRQLVAAWWDQFGDSAVKASDLLPLAVELESFDLGRGHTERAQLAAFGKKIAAQRDRVFGEYCIRSAGTSRRAALWQLVRVVNVENSPHSRLAV